MRSTTYPPFCSVERESEYFCRADNRQRRRRRRRPPPLKKFESAFKGSSRFLVQFLRPLNVRSAVAESAFAICSTLLCYTIKKQKTFFILNKFFIQVRDQCQLICNILHLRKKLSQECVQFSRAYL